MSENKRPALEDWRRQGQEKYLTGVKLIFRDYLPYRAGWNHDHCEFCGATFSLDKQDLNEGYVTEDNYRWVCNVCFNDFKNVSANSTFIINTLNGLYLIFLNLRMSRWFLIYFF